MRTDRSVRAVGAAIVLVVLAVLVFAVVEIGTRSAHVGYALAALLVAVAIPARRLLRARRLARRVGQEGDGRPGRRP